MRAFCLGCGTRTARTPRSPSNLSEAGVTI